MAIAQCWGAEFAPFEADAQLCRRTARHLERLRVQGVHIRRIQCSVVCVGNLNSARERGIHRFSSDLHAMERLLLAFRAETPRDIHATCGKVGGITDYPRFFGPLAGRLHTVLLNAENRRVRTYARLVRNSNLNVAFSWVRGRWCIIDPATSCQVTSQCRCQQRHHWIKVIGCTW